MREARLFFLDGKLESRDINRLLNFEEDPAIFFGSLGMFMYLFRGEMSNRTLHDWFLVPARTARPWRRSAAEQWTADPAEPWIEKRRSAPDGR